MRRLQSVGALVVSVPRAGVSSALTRLEHAPGVEWAQRDRVVMRIAEQTPTDPLWGQQWGASLIKAPTAWAVTEGLPGVVVAVLDTGVDRSHPDLEGALLSGYDFVNGDADPTDDQGHGTAVAGIVAARADNGLGGAGSCPKCSVLPVKVADANGRATEANVASGITWAVDQGARVLNISLGGDLGATVAAAVAYARSQGAVVVAAAGNNGNSAPFYPAANPGVLSVAGTQPDDQLYSWSNHGSWVAVAAPGCDLTTLRGGAYGEVCGTSASTPVVSGLAALAVSYAPTAAADSLTGAITSSAHRVGGVVHGRVDFAGTLAALGASFATAPAPVASPSAPPVPGAANATAPPVRARSAPPARLVVVAGRAAFRSRSRPSGPRRLLPLEIAGRWR